MDIEERIKECEDSLKQIKYFNPNPYYVNFFLKSYLKSVNQVYNGIFEEANIDFGLFIKETCRKDNFERKALIKNDSLALRFCSWFEKFYKDEHEKTYPNFINQILDFFGKNGELPKITTKILVDQKYSNDIIIQIQPKLINGKLRSKESLEIEIKRNTPIFVKLINQKRKNNNEPKISEENVIASSFLDFQNYEQIEITYACEIYLPVLKRIVKESRKTINNLLYN